MAGKPRGATSVMFPRKCSCCGEIKCKCENCIVITDEKECIYPLEEDVIRIHCYNGAVLHYSAEDDIKAGDKVVIKNCSVVRAKSHENEIGIALDDAEFFGTIYILYER
jgi:hypothetical protein